MTYQLITLSVVANTITLQVQEKVDLIDQLWAEMNELKASDEVLRSKMDLLASEKEATKEELASAKDKLKVVKDKANKWSKLNDELRAQLGLAVSEWDALGQEYTTLKYKLETASIDSFEARLIKKDEYMKWLLQRETLEEIHARGFDLSAKIEEAKRLEAQAKEIYEPEGSGSESGSGEVQAEMPQFIFCFLFVHFFAYFETILSCLCKYFWNIQKIFPSAVLCLLLFSIRFQLFI